MERNTRGQISATLKLTGGEVFDRIGKSGVNLDNWKRRVMRMRFARSPNGMCMANMRIRSAADVTVVVKFNAMSF